MQKPAKKTTTLVVSALGALVLALPVSSFASGARYYGYEGYSERPYYQEPYYGGQGQQWRDWQRLQHERQEMEEARREGDWDRYRHEKQEAREAARALRHDRRDWDD